MNYFNSLPLRLKLQQLGKCEFMGSGEFRGVDSLKGKKIVIVGCGAQGLNQGLNLRDSGLDVSYALRKEAIEQKRQSYLNASENGFKVGTHEEMIPDADLVANLTPDKQHTQVVSTIVPLMKKNSILSYSHGFNIVEEGMKIRDDITVIMVAPKSPGSEVREEYKRGFGVPTLIAVHTENDPAGMGLEYAKAYAAGLGSHRAGVLKSSFIAEVKSDLMGEQTILCGMLQTGSILCFDKMVADGTEPAYAAALIQYGWEAVTEAMKAGGITNMMDRLSNPAKIRAFELASQMKEMMAPLYEQHMDGIIDGEFSRIMMEDWADGDRNLLAWREETGRTAFETTAASPKFKDDQEYFDNGVLMVAMIKAGVELAFETMTSAGIKEESAYYESLHEVPLIANLISRKKLYEMNKIISDTAEYGCYLFADKCVPLLRNWVNTLEPEVIGRSFRSGSNGVSNKALIEVNDEIRNHPVEIIGEELRYYMSPETV